MNNNVHSNELMFQIDMNIIQTAFFLFLPCCDVEIRIVSSIAEIMPII
jgi:hypothetical protein